MAKRVKKRDPPLKLPDNFLATVAAFLNTPPPKKTRKVVRKAKRVKG